ncbi:imidazole glycerol phosphate synthase subunit HisH [Pseudomonas sp. NPDC089530]|uniref:imidazole glycerol phosphate synthase subunit HisH n=1 Tax=Pseudomonas sp. NPDC089530 TaxID=3390651 RepID=UPI003D06766C
MITIIDYGLGNIQAFVNVYKRLNIPVTIARQPADFEGATRLILPGVGAFDHAMERLDASGMRPTLERLVREQGVPVLGICVGMQILASASDEGLLPGLGWVKGRVKAFADVPELKGIPLPHMGWNDVRPWPDVPLFKGLEEDARFYFLHSFFFDCEGGGGSIASASYGQDFVCAVAEGNVFGVQFHPEKSHHFGAALLKNFAEL